MGRGSEPCLLYGYASSGLEESLGRMRLLGCCRVLRLDGTRQTLYSYDQASRIDCVILKAPQVNLKHLNTTQIREKEPANEPKAALALCGEPTRAARPSDQRPPWALVASGSPIDCTVMATTQSVYRSLVREVNRAVRDSANVPTALRLIDAFLDSLHQRRPHGQRQ